MRRVAEAGAQSEGRPSSTVCGGVRSSLEICVRRLSALETTWCNSQSTRVKMERPPDRSRLPVGVVAGRAAEAESCRSFLSDGPRTCGVADEGACAAGR